MSTAQQVSKSATASGGIGTGTSSTSWPRRSSRREASSHAVTLDGCDVDVRDDRGDEAGDPQPARLAVAGVEERCRTAAAPRTGRRRGVRPARRAARRRRGRCGRGCPAVASPTGSPYRGAPLIRPREGLRPTRPQHEAGIRIDPPPSEPGATGSRPGGDRGGRPAGGTAGGAGGVPRRDGGRRDVGLGVAGRPELRGARLAQARHPGGLDREDEVVGLVGHEVVVRRRAEGGAHPRGRVEVLDAGRDAPERTCVRGASRPRSVGARARAPGRGWS